MKSDAKHEGMGMASELGEGKLRIRTRYQRMAVANELAGLLLEHDDWRVANLAHEIRTVLGAPGSTLNHVLECFAPESKIVVRKLIGVKSASDHLLQSMRELRAAKAAEGK